MCGQKYNFLAKRNRHTSYVSKKKWKTVEVSTENTESRMTYERHGNRTGTTYEIIREERAEVGARRKEKRRYLSVLIAEPRPNTAKQRM